MIAHRHFNSKFNDTVTTRRDVNAKNKLVYKDYREFAIKKQRLIVKLKKLTGSWNSLKIIKLLLGVLFY